MGGEVAVMKPDGSGKKVVVIRDEMTIDE